MTHIESNIFEGAKFGDKFLTKDGEMCLFIKQFSEDNIVCIKYSMDTFGYYPMRYNDKGQYYISERMIGSKTDDIVSRYNEPIDEEKLDELAKNNRPEYISEMQSQFYTWEEGFKAGYKQAMEE